MMILLFWIIVFSAVKVSAAEKNAPVPPEKREAIKAEIIAEMESEVKGSLAKQQNNPADFMSYPIESNRRPRPDRKKELVTRLFSAIQQVRARARLVQSVFGSELRKLSDFIRTFHEKEIEAIERDFDEKIKDVNDHEQREKDKKLKKLHQEKRSEIDRLRSAANGAWGEAAPGRRTELAKRLKELYDQYVAIVALLRRLGEENKTEEFGEWSRPFQGVEPGGPREEKDRLDRRKKPEPGEEPDPEKRRKGLRFPQGPRPK